MYMRAKGFTALFAAAGLLAACGGSKEGQAPATVGVHGPGDVHVLIL